MSSSGLFARAVGPTAKAPSRGLLRPELFLSWTFLLPCAATAIATFLLASHGPTRHEAVLGISVPRPDTPGVEPAETFVDPVLVQDEIAPLAVFFRSPERMRGALLAVDPRAAAASEPKLERVSRRLASQVTLTGRETSPVDRIHVDVRLWSTRSDLPRPVLAYLGDELVRRSQRLDSILDRKIEEIRAGRDAQANEVERLRDSVRRLLEEHLPEGLDAPFDRLIDGDDWAEVLRQNFRRARADGDPLLGALAPTETDDGSETGDAGADATGGLDDAEAAGEIRSLASLRRRMRSLRNEIAREAEVLRDFDRQIEKLTERTRLLGRTATDEVRIEAAPAASETDRPKTWVALMALTIGIAAGSLALLLRLFLIDLRAPSLPGT